MSAATEVLSHQPVISPLDAFVGPLSPSKTGLLYKAGLAIVAFAMVLLPLIYVALIALTAWGVLAHLRHDTWILDGGSGRNRTGIFQLILYLGPAVVGGILVFFMVKPFFAPKAKAPEPITLNPTKEPLLFSFVRRICELVGAPMPSRIDVDCQVNASAGLRKGLWSKDLVLTIGLPLASGLDMRQFAGVLAHEFGHFAQGAGMRLTYIIRNINFWFARVVYERDSWDQQLEESARGSDLRIGIVLHAARGCVWVTRRILWVLMHAGHGISCFMLRQMEYDADSYEAKLAGSDAFATTAVRLRVLNVATQVAYEDVRQSWNSSRLPENLPLLIDHKAASLPDEVHQRLSGSAATEKTGWFDTHPCDNDRVKAVQRLKEPGVFRLQEPARGLFSDFSALSRTVTRYQYEKHFELEFTESNLMSAEEILRESTANAETEAMVRKYYGEVNISLKPLLSVADLEESCHDQLPAAWREAAQTTEQLRADAEKLSAECMEKQMQQISFTAACQLSKAGFKLEPAEFGFPPSMTSPVEQLAAAESALEGISSAIADYQVKIDPFMAALRRRVTLALAFAATNKTQEQAGSPGEAAGLARLLAVVGAQMPRAHQIGARLRAFTLLASNRGNHAQPAEVDQVISKVAAELDRLVGAIQDALKGFAYPFPHARGQLTVADYLRSEKTGENNWHRTFLESDAHVNRIFALHYQLVGRVLAWCHAGEKALERLGPAAEKVG